MRSANFSRIGRSSVRSSPANESTVSAPDGPEERIYPRVIDEALFERVQIVLSGRKGRKGAGRKDGFINLFSGLCRCEVCKKGVVIRRQKGKTYLVCEMARHGSCANRRYFPYARLEDLVLNFAGATASAGSNLAPSGARTRRRWCSSLQPQCTVRRAVVCWAGIGDGGPGAVGEVGLMSRPAM